MHLQIRDQIAVASDGHHLQDPADAGLARALSAFADRGVAARLVGRVGRSGLRQMSAPELAATGKITLPTAERLVAARELGELLAQSQPVAGSPTEVVQHLPPGFTALETEVMLGFALTGSLSIKALLLLSKGGLAGMALTPRDVFVPLVRLAAHAVVLVHNHPSGDPTPSEEDVTFTNAIARAGSLLGIEVIDHIIVAVRGTTSFADSGLLLTEEELGHD
jgi:DNA repair protein RadC